MLVHLLPLQDLVHTAALAADDHGLPRGHAVFAKSSYGFVFSGATTDGAYLVDDTSDHRTLIVKLTVASTDSGTVTVTVPALADTQL